MSLPAVSTYNITIFSLFGSGLFVYDPNTGELIAWDKSKPRNGQWDMGHKYGFEFWKNKKDYMDGKITKSEFLEIQIIMLQNFLRIIEVVNLKRNKKILP